jgi:parallel beta-helix repeat protein
MQVFKGLKLKTVLPIVLFAALMTWLLLFVLAAGPFVSIETESASISGNVEVKTDSNASAGSYLSFGTTSTGGGGSSSNWDVGPRAMSCSGVTVNPGDNIQSKVDSNSEGTTFCLKKGVYRNQTITPKNNDKFIGEVGTVLNGSKVLSGWTQSGSNWVVGGQTQESSMLNANTCVSNRPNCARPEEVFRDGKRLIHAASLSAVKSGYFYFDYAGNKIYIGDNPSGHTLEASVTDYALKNGSTGVTVKNLIIAQYATPGQRAALGAEGVKNWTIQYNEIRNNHGNGVKAGADSKVLNNYIHRNGMLGISGGSSNLLIQDNEIAYQNENLDVGYVSGLSAGTKWVKAQDVVIRHNYVHDNGWAGLWTDGSNYNILYENNLIEDNGHNGIFHEISYDAVIRNNIIRRNGFRSSNVINGAGIMLQTSSHVEIYGNVIEENRNSISLYGQNRGDNWTREPFKNYDNYVHNNTFKISSGYVGVAGSNSDTSTIKFENNTYKGKGSGNYFHWLGSDANLSWTQWKALGNDKNGSYSTY